jgi:hypothetical protein
MGAAVWVAARVLIPVQAVNFSGLLAGLLGCVMIGLIVFGACCYLIKSPEFVAGIVKGKIIIGKK